MSLQRLVEPAGVELRRQGKDLVGCCPFHEDRTPSLVISPAKNLWHCLGACQAGGSVIDWVMRSEGVSFRHAVELLRDGVAPSPVAAAPAPARVSTVTKLPSPVERAADDRELLERVVGFYAQTLKESPEALGYLERRGLGIGSWSSVPAGVRESDAGLPVAGEEPPGGRGAPRPVAAAGGVAGVRA